MVALNQAVNWTRRVERLERAAGRVWQWLLGATVPVMALVLLFAIGKAVAFAFLTMKGTGILADLLSQGVAIGDTGRIVGLVLEHARGLVAWTCAGLIASSVLRYSVKAELRRNARRQAAAASANDEYYSNLAGHYVDSMRRAKDLIYRGDYNAARHELERGLEG